MDNTGNVAVATKVLDIASFKALSDAVGIKSSFVESEVKGNLSIALLGEPTPKNNRVSYSVNGLTVALAQGASTVAITQRGYGELSVLSGIKSTKDAAGITVEKPWSMWIVR